MRFAVAIAAILSGCTTYNEDGELVRHHLGYVRVITPAVHAPEGPVQALGVDNFGIWMDVDRRRADQKTGSGLGLGYRSDNRSVLPATCRIIFRVETKDQFDASVALLQSLDLRGEDLCVIKERSL